MKHISSRTITGIVVIIIGASLLLSSLDLWNFGSIVSTWWPLIVVAVGVITFVNDRSAYVWALLLIAIGSVLQLNRLDVIDVSIWSLIWPILIIVMGVSLLTSRRMPRKRGNTANRQEITAILGGTEQKDQTEDYQGSKVTTIMGGVVLDLRNVTIV